MVRSFLGRFMVLSGVVVRGSDGAEGMVTLNFLGTRMLSRLVWSSSDWVAESNCVVVSRSGEAIP